MITINLETLFWALLLTPFLMAITHGIVSMLVDWMTSEGRFKKEAIVYRTPNKPLAVVFVLAGLLCWYLGDNGTSYNLLLVILGYILLYVAYKKYKGSPNSHQLNYTNTQQKYSQGERKNPLPSKSDTEVETHWL